MSLSAQNTIPVRTRPLLAVITNPLSTTNKTRLPKIRQIVENGRAVVHFEMSDMDSINEALALFNREKPEVIVVNGGDGTVDAVMAAYLYRDLFDYRPAIAIMPGGKTNMTAADMGLKGKPEKVLLQLMAWAEDGSLLDRVEERHVLELDLGDGSEPRVGKFFGTAGIVKAIFWCRENAFGRGWPNWLEHLYAFGKIFLSAFGLGKDKDMLVSSPMKINVLGAGIFEGQYSVVMATTLNRLLFNLKPYGDSGSGGIKFSATEPGGRVLWRAFRGLLSKSFGNKYLPGVHTRKGNEVRILATDPVTLDGEMFDPVEGQEMVLKGDKTLPFVIFDKKLTAGQSDE